MHFTLSLHSSMSKQVFLSKLTSKPGSQTHLKRHFRVCRLAYYLSVIIVKRNKTQFEYFIFKIFGIEISPIGSLCVYTSTICSTCALIVCTLIVVDAVTSIWGVWKPALAFTYIRTYFELLRSKFKKVYFYHTPLFHFYSVSGWF